MSSDLPERPSLEYLKKRAKERLRELQLRDPNAKLADALHAIAREYGFVNWAQLKETVGSIAHRTEQQPSPTETTAPLFPRFTTSAKRATFFSRFEAAELGHPAIDPEHLLLGVIRARAGLANRLLTQTQLSPDRIRADVRNRREAHEPLSRFHIIAFSENSKRTIQLAAAESDRLQHNDIGTVHLLLGILHDEASLAASILRESGVTIDAVRNEVDDLLNEERSG